MFLAFLYLRSGSKEAARVEFDELKISFRRGLDKYDLMLGCVDLIEPSLGFVRTFRVTFLSYERFLKLQEILKFLLLFAYVAGVFLTIKFGFAEAAIYAAAGIFAILIASKLVVARRLDGRTGGYDCATACYCAARTIRARRYFFASVLAAPSAKLYAYIF